MHKLTQPGLTQTCRSMVAKLFVHPMNSWTTPYQEIRHSLYTRWIGGLMELSQCWWLPSPAAVWFLQMRPVWLLAPGSDLELLGAARWDDFHLAWHGRYGKQWSERIITTGIFIRMCMMSDLVVYTFGHWPCLVLPFARSSWQYGETNLRRF